ncbi:hypothetical protein BV25DRAFT_1281794 [Artomyces pyxidatus]|uniref:Uncharacterized protein n=1 Tax=Artomyces pyxidatus TaxID=48021 RepID=A0ACB8SP93_9AGAM|nr:hypothetical protein BV25DRAFT_1281794 [Artomyces pyxidatus]
MTISMDAEVSASFQNITIVSARGYRAPWCGKFPFRAENLFCSPKSADSGSFDAFFITLTFNAKNGNYSLDRDSSEFPHHVAVDAHHGMWMSLLLPRWPSTRAAWGPT